MKNDITVFFVYALNTNWVYNWQTNLKVNFKRIIEP